MFILRCAFFLSIVWVSIAFGSEAVRNPHAVEAAVAGGVSGIAGTAVARATDWCAERPARCSRDAARLTALVETTLAEPVSGGDEEPIAASEMPRTPMPVPDPRRRAAGAVLTAGH